MDALHDLEIVLAALYLRGAPRAESPRRAGWPEVLRALRQASVSLREAPEALREAGLRSEALILEDQALRDWAQEQVEGDRTLTPAHPAYPANWLKTLGASAPPALWRRGSMPEQPFLAIVGGRQIPGKVRAFCSQAGQIAAQNGYAIVSGRAQGCDQAGVVKADRFVEIVPHGLNHTQPGRRDCLLSACPPGDIFTTAAAMERNALIYAAGTHTLIGQARLKEGGTWHAATSAIRHRLCRLIIREDTANPAHRALIGLGAIPLVDPGDLLEKLVEPSAQPNLFEATA